MRAGGHKIMQSAGLERPMKQDYERKFPYGPRQVGAAQVAYSRQNLLLSSHPPIGPNARRPRQLAPTLRAESGRADPEPPVPCLVQTQSRHKSLS